MPSEPAVFARYLRELWRHAEAFAGSLAVLLILWALDALKPAWWESPQPWVYIAIAALGIFVAQYRTWRALLRQEQDGPEVRGPLTLEYERPSDIGDNALEAGVRIKQEIPAGWGLYLLCDAPIRGGNGWIGNVPSVDELRVIRQYHGVLPVHVTLEEGALLEFRVYGTRPIALRKLHLIPPDKKPFF